jgi:hypothetical protein
MMDGLAETTGDVCRKQGGKEGEKRVRSKRSAFERKSSTRVTTKPEVHLSMYA